MMAAKSEARTFHHTTFVRKLECYYNAQNSNVAFEIGGDGSCIWRYDVQPHGAKWFNKLIPDDTFSEWQDEAFIELTTIFFPGEDVIVTGIYQFPEIENSDITLFITPNGSSSLLDDDHNQRSESK